MKKEHRNKTTNSKPHAKRKRKSRKQLRSLHDKRSRMEIVAYAFGIFAFVLAAIAALFGVIHYRDLAIWTTCLAIVFAVIGGFCWLQDREWKKEALKLARSPTERPYVFIKRATLQEPLTKGKDPVLKLEIKNSGPIEATGEFKDVSYYFTFDPSDNVFAYNAGNKISFALAPTAEVTLTAPMAFAPTEEQVTALMAGKARLFIYGRGNYSGDSGGKVYSLDFCLEFSPTLGPDLVVCDKVRIK